MDGLARINRLQIMALRTSGYCSISDTIHGLRIALLSRHYRRPTGPVGAKQSETGFEVNG